ncbi:hypothetical protein OG21DRAFT_1527309 [Imleria badia]|nr:hypothetical protein OG21DRAFT_1527309 [Imleria badia]
MLGQLLLMLTVSVNTDNDNFKNQVAIKLSRALSTLNPLAPCLGHLPVQNIFLTELHLEIISHLKQGDAGHRHMFRPPAKPLEPPNPRGSLLGLDCLAKEKRDQPGWGGIRMGRGQGQNMRCSNTFGRNVIGELPGVKTQGQEAEAETETETEGVAEKAAPSEEKEDYKGDTKFASHLKMTAGVSSLAKNSTLKEHEGTFACREELGPVRTVKAK